MRGPPPKRRFTNQPTLYVWPPDKWPKHHYMKNIAQIPLRNKIVQLFIGALDGHVAFTTLLWLDASFVMAPYALHHCHPATPDMLQSLRSKPAKLTAWWFWGPNHPNCPSSHGRHATRCWHMFGLHQAFDAFTPLDSTDAVFITSMYSCSSVYHVDRSTLFGVSSPSV